MKKSQRMILKYANHGGNASNRRMVCRYIVRFSKMFVDMEG